MPKKPSRPVIDPMHNRFNHADGITGKPYPRPGKPKPRPPKLPGSVNKPPAAVKPPVPAKTPAAKTPVVKPKPPKPTAKPKPGYRWQLSNGVWKQAKKLDYISNEIENQIAAAKQLTDYQQKYAKSVYDQMAADAKKIAGAYQPSQFTGPEALAGNRWADLYARAGGAAAAAQNLATLQGVGAQRANLGRQQLEYARYLRQQRPYLQQQYQAQQDAQRLAQLQADIAAQYKQGQLNLGYDKLASQERIAGARINAANQRAQVSAAQKFSTAQQKQLADLRKELFKTTMVTLPSGEKDTRWVYPRQQFRTSMERIMELGFKPRDAASIAAQWAAASDKQAGKRITFKKGREYGLYKAMVNRGVRPRYAEAIVRRYYPNFSAKKARMSAADLMKAGYNAARGA